MKGSRAATTVIDLDRRNLAAIHAVMQDASVAIRAWVVETLPEQVEWTDAVSVGHWVGQTIKDAGFGRGPVVLSVPRADLVLKTVRVAAEGLDEDELVEMIRLQLRRQVTFTVDDAAVDFIEIASRENDQRAFLVAAMPGERIAWIGKMAQAAGVKLARIELRSAGAAALLAINEQIGPGAALAVCVGPESTELVLGEGGDLVFARSVRLDRAPGAVASTGTNGQTADALVERLVVEVQRTVMSMRAANLSGAPTALYVLGEHAAAQAMAERLEASLDLPAHRLSFAEVVTGVEGAEPSKISAVLPLAGLVVRHSRGGSTLDLANPAKAPDRAAERRQRRLAAAFGLLLICGTAYVIGSGRLGAIDRKIAAAETQRTDRAVRYAAGMTLDARLTHAEQWGLGRTDWIAHLAHLNGLLPPTSEAIVDGLKGGSQAEVVFTRGDATGYPGKWSVNHAAKITLDGRVQSRDATLGLRGRLVEGEVYSVLNKGPDVEDRFSFELLSRLTSPPVEGASP